MEKTLNLLKTKCMPGNFEKLVMLNNPALLDFLAKYVEICRPDKIFVSTDRPEDISFIRETAVKNDEEGKLSIDGHTVHFDGYYDQARDQKNTKFLLAKGVDLGPNIKSTDKKEGLKEIYGFLKNSMNGRMLFIQFFCLGPTNSEFSILAVQLTDSSYVAHSQDLLYRLGYEEFKKLDKPQAFFKFVHSAGELKNGVSKNVDQRRIYIDIEEDIVYSVNTQYGGNTLGHKKLAMRLAINKASEESWLTEHMFLMGVHGPKGRVTYFTGAFPSLCGKTSTSMLKGETIVGDDIAYLRVKDAEIRAVNVEKGMFGIIQGINSKDDPIIWKALNSAGEVIFSNILVTEDNHAYWLGKNTGSPEKGFNHAGNWFRGKLDADSKEVPLSHPNARFTLGIKLLENIDPELNNPEGVAVKGIIYGGRDSDTWLPVEQSFNWKHGIITKGASLESETTAAALGKSGIRKFNPMANLAFLSIPIGKYIKNNLKFGGSITSPPLIFSVNYFLKDNKGNFINDKIDKAVWLKWMELRVHNEVGAIKTPTGYIPKYEDLKKLFKETFNKDYSQEDYIAQFTLRVPENLVKIDRIIKIYKTKVPDTPDILFKILKEQKKRLEDIKLKKGDYITPNTF
ncbi:MAG: phosphoenolpyruvate carboxykinase (GTP) [Candidatus Omnitrophota bacterium]|nr:phosphoenolpyruvate carboxykinase (GTP) [Candidatus Omnitrophota bacterium]